MNEECGVDNGVQETKTQDGLFRRLSEAGFWRDLLNPWRQEDSDFKPASAPIGVKALCAVGLLLMLNQVRFPVFGGRVALGDLGFLLGFIPVFLYSLKARRPLHVPGFALLVVLAALGVNVLTGPGVPGAVELCQLLAQLVCGVALMGFLVEEAPWLGYSVVFLAFLLNLGQAAFFAVRSGGDFSAPAPADVLTQAWGFGRAYSGFFRSRMSLSFFMTLALAWLTPSVYGRRGNLLRAVVGFVVLTAGLLAIVHGQMLLVACLTLVPGLFLLSRAAGISGVLAVCTALLTLSVAAPGTVRSTLNPIKMTQHPGELKTNHLDFAAALKMMASRPLTGVGAGRYQEGVGSFYGELPNPVRNDIECDTQSGWGILLSTNGLPVAALLLMLLAGSAAAGVSRYFRSSRVNTLALGGGLALFAFIPGMLVSDGMTRGLSWMLALALASALFPNPREELPPFCRMTPASFAAFLLVCAVLLGIICVRGKSAEPIAKTTCVCEEAPAAGQKTAPAALFTCIVDAGDALKLTPPFERGTDATAAKGSILRVPDGAGVPPEGKTPAMEYGGAVFSVELPEAAECRIWLRVRWDNSCGNTVNLLVDDEPTSVTIGNDGTYRAWHWLPSGRTYSLAAGQHTITLLNREDGIQFDQMLVTSDSQYIPQDIEED